MILKYIQSGDVVVVKGEEFSECEVTGDLMMGMAQNSGLWAFITDSHICDDDGLEPLNIALFANGLNPNGLYKAGPGKIGLPMSIGGYIVVGWRPDCRRRGQCRCVKACRYRCGVGGFSGHVEERKGRWGEHYRGAKFYGNRRLGACIGRVEMGELSSVVPASANMSFRTR